MEETLLRVTELKKWFPVRVGFVKSIVGGEKLFVKAVDGISFDIKPGEIYGLAGESGSGKTTTGRLVLRLIEPTAGKVYYKDKEITRLTPKEFGPYRRKMQIIFQDPYESLNPRMTIGTIVSEPLHVQRVCKNEQEVEERVHQALEEVELTPPEEFFFRYPHEVSGGQRQRIAVARALVLKPDFIVADEPVSMLDVSIRAEVLNLMVSLMEKRNVAFLYVTHDLALARHLCNRIGIMYLGKIMERGYTEDIIYEPLHPYTRALMAAVPVPDPESKRAEVVIKGEIPSPINPPSGCRFHTRCPSYIGDICRLTEPTLVHVGKDRYVACHLYSEKAKDPI
jgi:peptide/nickel transport system ATP-binding protein